MSARNSRERNPNSDRVPQPGDPDRKRVLNVLAQRRYRKRRRDRLAALEAQVQGPSTPHQLAKSLPSPPTSEDASTSLGTADDDSAEFFSNHSLAQEIVLAPPSFEPAPFDSDVDLSVLLHGNINTGGTEMPPIINSPSNPTFDFESFVIEPTLLQPPVGLDVPQNPEPDSQSPNLDFSDDFLIDLPCMRVLRASVQIAKMLGSENCIFDPMARHVLQPITHASIPDWLQPTLAQQRIPHHPVIDLFPWPSVRNKIICVFAQPVQVRPPSARDPLALVTLMADIDDEQEGMKVFGEEGLHGDNWEVGQVFFNNWWWALDRSIVNNSNMLREKRGAARLLLPGCST